MFSVPFFSSLFFASSSFGVASSVFFVNDSFIRKEVSKELDSISKLGSLGNLEVIKDRKTLIINDLYALFSKVSLLSESYLNLGNNLTNEVERFSDISNEEKANIKAQIFSFIKKRDLSNKKVLFSLISLMSKDLKPYSDLSAMIRAYSSNLSVDWSIDFPFLHSKYNPDLAQLN